MAKAHAGGARTESVEKYSGKPQRSPKTRRFAEEGAILWRAEKTKTNRRTLFVRIVAIVCAALTVGLYDRRLSVVWLG